MSYSAGVKFLAGMALAAAAVGAQAQSYVGALVQMSNYNNDKVCSSYGVSNCDSSAHGLKAYVGTVVSDSMALEAAYVDFGKVKATGSEGRVKSYVFAAVLRADVFRGLVISGKAGVAATTATVRAGSLSDDEQHPSLYLGAGIEYPIYKTIKVVGAFDWTRAQINEEKFGVSAFGLGAQIDF